MSIICKRYDCLRFNNSGCDADYLSCLKENLLVSEGRFTWDFGSRFAVETNLGLFEWSDPEYNGDNSMRFLVNKSFSDWLEMSNIPYGRDKGNHIVKDYCGKEFNLIIVNG